ncbi:MAG: ferritin family protein [Desulfobacterales bacterium]
MNDKSVAEVIDIAIRREEEAYRFYMDICGKVQDRSARDTLEFIAKEEQKHRDFLVGYRDGGYGAQALRMNDPIKYKIAEYLEEPPVSGEMRSQDVYLIAAHREKRSHDFYTELARLHSQGDLHTMLLKIASEELKHKEKMEYLYANTAFPQTEGG